MTYKTNKEIREKLVVLLMQCDMDSDIDNDGVICDGCGRRPLSEACVAIADHLIANGVRVQPSKKEKPLTDLSGKCGSCVFAESAEAFGGSKCYVECKNPEFQRKARIASVKQRTSPACKRYKPQPPKGVENA